MCITEDGKALAHNYIRGILEGSKLGLKGWEIQQRCFNRFGKQYSESSITARTRQMEDVFCNLSTNRYVLRANNGQA